LSNGVRIELVEWVDAKISRPPMSVYDNVSHDLIHFIQTGYVELGPALTANQCKALTQFVSIDASKPLLENLRTGDVPTLI